MEIARAGDWAAFVPVSGISADALQGGLRIYRVPRELLALTWHLIHPNDRSLQPGATAFIRLVESALEERKRNFERLAAERRSAAA
jgi:DNA-binding transcriptional LysR family regulator